MKLTDYFRDIKGEMKHVTWPTRNQAVGYTILVIAISVFVAAYLGLFDYIFTHLIEAIIY